MHLVSSLYNFEQLFWRAKVAFFLSFATKYLLLPQLDRLLKKLLCFCVTYTLLSVSKYWVLISNGMKGLGAGKRRDLKFTLWTRKWVTVDTHSKGTILVSKDKHPTISPRKLYATELTNYWEPLSPTAFCFIPKIKSKCTLVTWFFFSGTFP